MPTGGYVVVVEQTAFQKLRRSGIRLTAADVLTVDLQLSLGNVQETVEVTATAPLIQSQTAAVSSLVTQSADGRNAFKTAARLLRLCCLRREPMQDRATTSRTRRMRCAGTRTVA